VFLPPNHTNYLQLIDDNVGKSFRELVYAQYDAWMESFDISSKLTASDCRVKLIEWCAIAAKQWNGGLDETIGMAVVVLFSG
jgi:hypothetical protein